MTGSIWTLAGMLGSAEVEAETPLIQEPGGVLAVLLCVLAVIFWHARHPVIGRLFKVIPVLVFCYFVPTALSTFGVIPHSSPLYDWITEYILPASLLLLILSLDVGGIIRLGPKAIIMVLAGTVGVVIGGPIALFICRGFVDPEAWRGLTALSGSWIGGGANFWALADVAQAPDSILSPIIVVDVFVANIWMGVLLFSSQHQHRIDGWTGADASAIRDLERRMTEYHEQVSRVAGMPDYMTIIAFAFAGAWVSNISGARFGEYVRANATWLEQFIPGSAWRYIIVTAIGLILSFTRARRLEGVGASKIGSLMIYLLVASIGAHANFAKIWENKELILVGIIWMICHVIVLLSVGKLIRAPVFFVAVGSQANIGGAASAPVVAAAFHPSLAAVGALMAVAGYVLGTYAGLVCMHLLKYVSGA